MSLNKLSIFYLLGTHIKQENASRIASKLSSSFKWVFNYEFLDNGRVWLGWDPSFWNVTVLHKSAQQITCSVSSVDGLVSCVVTSVYANNTREARKSLWSDLHQVQASFPENNPPWCVLGYFNAILSDSETNADIPQLFLSKIEFKDCIGQLGITDLRLDGSLFTW